MEGGTVTINHGISLRWDLLVSQSPSNGGLTVRLAAPKQSTEVYIAVDTSHRRYVLVRVPDGEPGILAERTSQGIAVQTVELRIDELGRRAVFIEIACFEPAGYAALDIVAIELVEAITAGASIGRVRLVQTVLLKWRRFWSGIPRNLLSKEQHLGLFGELWFMQKWLLPTVSNQAIAMWRGPIGARNDFEHTGWAVEVKTSGKLDGSHIVHGLEQLLTPPGVQVFLFSILVREEASGVESVPKLVQAIRERIEGDHIGLTQFEGMLAASGYDDAHADEYGKTKFRVRGQGLYRVEPGFPRLIPDSLLEGLPPGVSKVNYELSLNGAGHWLVADTPIAFALTLPGLINITPVES